MTPAEKLALAQRAYAAFSPLDIDAIIPLYHPECEWRMAPGREVFGADAFRGHEGLRAFVAFIGEASDSYAAEIDEARITPEGALLVSNTTHARSSGAARMELSARGWQALEFRDGLILSIVQFGGTPPGVGGGHTRAEPRPYSVAPTSRDQYPAMSSRDHSG